jgi:predicted GIY-YIG superfamily endonuclease
MAVVIPWLYVVYRLYDADGTPLYIGSTKSLASRLDGHRRTKPWWSEVERLETEQFASIDEMREAEQRRLKASTPGTTSNTTAQRGRRRQRKLRHG